MSFTLKILLHLCLYTGVQCVSNIRALNCKFSDQESFINDQGTHDIRTIHKDVILQFGQKREAAVKPDAITFLLSGTNLDLRFYLEKASEDQLECELHRHNTNGAHVQWPLQETKDYNYWYNCIIRHRLFTVSSFLRQPSPNPAPGQHDYHNWTEIKAGDILNTTVALIMKTNTPEVRSSLGAQTKLDCHFVFDHEGADYSLEWFTFAKGQKKQLFSHNSRSGLTEGTGVDLKALKKGDASYDLPAADKTAQQTFYCSVSVNPLVAKLNIDWTIEEKPEVSLTVHQLLLIQEGEVTRIYCRANHFYPRDVKMIWYRYKPTASSQTDLDPLPELLNKTHSGHRTNHRNGTLSLFSFITIHPSVKDSGTKFTCNVFHQSLNVPIRTSFTIQVEDPMKNLLKYCILYCPIIIPALLYLIYKIRSGRRRRARQLPY